MIYIKQYDAKFMSLAIWVLNMLTPDRLKCASPLVLKLRSVSSLQHCDWRFDSESNMTYISSTLEGLLILRLLNDQKLAMIVNYIIRK